MNSVPMSDSMSEQAGPLARIEKPDLDEFCKGQSHAAQGLKSFEEHRSDDEENEDLKRQNKQRREKKMRMRRQRVLQAAAEVQDPDYEPKVSDAQYQLPEFEFLGINHDNETPFDICDFGSMNLSEPESPFTKTLGKKLKEMHGSSSISEDASEAAYSPSNLFPSDAVMGPQEEDPVDTRQRNTLTSDSHSFLSLLPVLSADRAPSNTYLTRAELSAIPPLLKHRYGLQSMCIQLRAPFPNGMKREYICIKVGNTSSTPRAQAVTAPAFMIGGTTLSHQTLSDKRGHFGRLCLFRVAVKIPV